MFQTCPANTVLHWICLYLHLCTFLPVFPEELLHQRYALIITTGFCEFPAKFPRGVLASMAALETWSSEHSFFLIPVTVQQLIALLNVNHSKIEKLNFKEKEHRV